MPGTLIICVDLESLSREAARRIQAAASQAGRKFRIALAGGSTPRRLYELLASPEFASHLPWERMHFFWGDERLVPRDHTLSNYRLARDTLLKNLPIPPRNLHPVPLGGAPEEAALAYERDLRAHFGRRWGAPRFDVILLGLGDDGHVASLFPRAAALNETKRLVVATRPGGGQPPRVTLTLPVLNAARRVFFLVAGAEKAAILGQVLDFSGQLPAQRVAPRKGELLWLVDSAAASRLRRVRVAAVGSEAQAPAPKEAGA